MHKILRKIELHYHLKYLTLYSTYNSPLSIHLYYLNPIFAPLILDSFFSCHASCIFYNMPMDHEFHGKEIHGENQSTSLL